MSAKPSLRTELLFNLAFLAAAALLLGVVTVLLVSAVAPERAVLLILTIVAADVAIFIVFGRYVVDRKSTRLNSSHSQISYAVFCLKKKKYIMMCTRLKIHSDTLGHLRNV